MNVIMLTFSFLFLFTHGSIRGFCFVRNFIKYGQYRSIKVNHSQTEVNLSQLRYVRPFIRWSVGHIYIIFADFGLFKLS